jgi:hypothetical protein
MAIRTCRCASALYRRLASDQLVRETVPVQHTHDGTRFFVFQCQRYVIDVAAGRVRPTDPVLGQRQLVRPQSDARIDVVGKSQSVLIMIISRQRWS